MKPRLLLLIAVLILIGSAGLLLWPDEGFAPTPTAQESLGSPSPLAAASVDGWCCLETETTCVAMQRAAFCLGAEGRFFHADETFCNELCPFSAR